MAEDLFGLRQNVARYRQMHVAPRRKIGAVPRPKPVRVATVHEPLSPEALLRFQRQQWQDYLAWALEELARWKHRLPAAEYEQQHARLMTRKALLEEAE